MRIPMRALVTIEYYDGQRIRRGEDFSAKSEADAHTLDLLDKARKVGPPIPPPEPEPEAEPVRKKRQYRRRDLTAEP